MTAPTRAPTPTPTPTPTTAATGPLPGRHRRQRGAPVGALLVAVGLVLGSDGAALLAWAGRSTATPVEVGTLPAAAAPTTPTTPAVPLEAQHLTKPVVVPAPSSAPPPAPAAPPVQLSIPRIGVTSLLVGLRVGSDGTLGVPTDFARAGWWRDGVAPGDPGPAILLGHIDSYTGPAVFYRLRSLRPGDAVSILRADGSTVTFAVDALREYAKQRFPTDLVYGATKAPTLRLITCGGSFDQQTGHYNDNVVVYAHLVGSSRPGPPAPQPRPPARADARAGLVTPPATRHAGSQPARRPQ